MFNGGKSTVSKNDVKAYRYGYQGSEQDNEIKGNGNSYTTLYRQLDPRVGRWLSIDPVTQPWQSPYISMDNNPIWHNDVLGDVIKPQGYDRKERRQVRRQMKAARKNDPAFDRWYEEKDAEAKINYVSLSSHTEKVGQNDAPSGKFTTPLYHDKDNHNDLGTSQLNRSILTKVSELIIN